MLNDFYANSSKLEKPNIVWMTKLMYAETIFYPKELIEVHNADTIEQVPKLSPKPFFMQTRYMHSNDGTNMIPMEIPIIMSPNTIVAVLPSSAMNFGGAKIVKPIPEISVPKIMNKYLFFPSNFPMNKQPKKQVIAQKPVNISNSIPTV